MTEPIPQGMPAGVPGPGIAPLGKSAGRGAAALTASSLVMRTLSFIGQIVLGAILLREDFGLFAIANSVAAFVVVLQDGGMRTLIVQKGAQEYEQLEGPAFWLGFVFNLAAASLLVGTAPIAALIYGEPKLVPMLGIIASAILLNSLGTVPLALLRMHMRFGPLAAIEVIGGLLRYGGMILCAYAGLGPMAFVAPLPAVAIFEGVAGYLFTHRTPWARPPRVGRWRSLIGASTWLVAAAVAGSALYLGSNMALGLTASAGLVGVYFFGSSIVIQSGYLIISTAERVLLPVISRLRAEPERQRSAVVRTLRVVSVLGFSACAAIGTLFPSVEHLVWRGKWAATVGVVEVLAVAYPIFTLHVVARCVITGLGRFRAHALSVAVSGAVLMLVAAAAGAITTDPTVISWIIGLAMVVVSCGYLVWGVRGLRLGPVDLLREILPIGLCGAAALLVGILADRFALATIGVRGLDPASESLRIRFVADGIRMAVAGLSSAAVLLGTLRAFARDALHDCLEALPDRLGRLPRRLMAL